MEKQNVGDPAERERKAMVLLMAKDRGNLEQGKEKETRKRNEDLSLSSLWK